MGDGVDPFRFIVPALEETEKRRGEGTEGERVYRVMTGLFPSTLLSPLLPVSVRQSAMQSLIRKSVRVRVCVCRL